MHLQSLSSIVTVDCLGTKRFKLSGKLTSLTKTLNVSLLSSNSSSNIATLNSTVSLPFGIMIVNGPGI